MSLLGWLNPLQAIFAPLSAITKQLADTRIALAAEANSERRIVLEEKQSLLEARQNILLSEQGHWSTRMIRPLFALPFVIYLSKVVVWDKVFALGVTDALSTDLKEIMMLVIAAYFLDTAVQRFTKR